MSQDVKIPFRSRLESGESAFVVEIQNKFVQETNRKFGIRSITLMPEFQNVQAFAYNLDSKQEHDEVRSHAIQLEVIYGPNYFSNDAPGKVWTFSSSLTQIGYLLASINNHFDLHKPSGTFLPPLFFDWFHLDALGDGETIQGYQEKTSEIAYGEAFDPAKHSTWLPPSLAGKMEMNNCIFPTMNNQEFLKDVRVRMWIAPNTTITFPNSVLPKILGFGADQVPTKSKRNQVPFENQDAQHYLCLTTEDKPQFKLPSDSIRGTNINCYTTSNAVTSPRANLQTKKKHKYNPVQIFSDYAPAFEKLAKSINIILSLSFDSASKTFLINFPNNPNIYVRIHLPSKVMRQLGFDMSLGEFIDNRTVSLPVGSTLDTTDLEKKAKALVYDTGMVVVSMKEHTGQTTMATLEPQKEGVLRNRPSRWELPQVHLSSINPGMHFMLQRFNDNNQRFSLDWPVGAYVFGEIVGLLNHSGPNHQL